MGLEMMIKGVKRISPSVAPVTAIPVRRRRMEPEIRRVDKPTSWLEFEPTWTWSLRRSAEPLWVVGLWVGAGSAIREILWIERSERWRQEVRVY